ncbi:MAG: hypothetical protein Fur0016_12030 [Anaerolineales bacterium]
MPSKNHRRAQHDGRIRLEAGHFVERQGLDCGVFAEFIGNRLGDFGGRTSVSEVGDEDFVHRFLSWLDEINFSLRRR